MRAAFCQRRRLVSDIDSWRRRHRNRQLQRSMCIMRLDYELTREGVCKSDDGRRPIEPSQNGRFIGPSADRSDLSGQASHTLRKGNFRNHKRGSMLFPYQQRVFSERNETRQSRMESCTAGNCKEPLGKIAVTHQGTRGTR